jgi:hypothetical protein
MTDPPNVPANVSNVYVNYSAIFVGTPSPDNTTEYWYYLSGPGQVDLMSLVNESVTVGGSEVPAGGTYDEVTFNVTSAVITYLGINFSSSTSSVALENNYNVTAQIEGGGVSIGENSSNGLLLDVSPTISDFQNDSGVFFVLDASAVGVPIPEQDWNSSLAVRGATVNLAQSSWWQNSTAQIQGNITINYVILSNDTLQVFVENIGDYNVTVNEVSILENVSQAVDQANSSSTTSTDTANSSTDAENSDNETQNTNLQYYLRSVGDFQVLSNGTLVPPSLVGQLNDSSSASSGNVTVGLVVQPNETITLDFEGNVTQDSMGNNLSGIIVGNTYEIAVLGDFGTSVYLTTVNPIYCPED